MRLHVLFVVIVCGVVTIAAVSVATAPTATISVAGSQSIPEQEFSIDGETFTPETVSVNDPGDQLDVEITVSNASTYRIAVYNTAEQIVEQKRRSTDATVTIDLSGYSAGTYLIAVVQDGSFLAVHPVVVRGYTLSADAPTTAADLSVSVTVESEQRRGPTAEYIEVILTDGDSRVETQLNQTAGTQNATVDVTSLSSGEYEIYAAARGGTDIYGKPEFLGLTPAQTIELTTDTSTPTPTPTDTPGAPPQTQTPSSTATPPSAGTPSGTATETPETAPPGSAPPATSTPPNESSATVTPTSTEATTTEPPTVSPTASGPTQTTAQTPTATPTESTATPTPTADSVVTPYTEISTPQTEQPGFGALVTVLAVMAVVLIYRRR